jgi:hypothetical protein
MKSFQRITGINIMAAINFGVCSSSRTAAIDESGQNGSVFAENAKNEKFTTNNSRSGS